MFPVEQVAEYLYTAMMVRPEVPFAKLPQAAQRQWLEQAKAMEQIIGPWKDTPLAHLVHKWREEAQSLRIHRGVFLPSEEVEVRVLERCALELERFHLED